MAEIDTTVPTIICTGLETAKEPLCLYLIHELIGQFLVEFTTHIAAALAVSFEADCNSQQDIFSVRNMKDPWRCCKVSRVFDVDNL